MCPLAQTAQTKLGKGAFLQRSWDSGAREQAMEGMAMGRELPAEKDESRGFAATSGWSPPSPVALPGWGHRAGSLLVSLSIPR